MALKRNLIANYLGQGWAALMGLAFVPLYIKYLGIEAYGLIGLFAVLQGWLSLLDMGMTPTLAREMARFTGGAHSSQSIRDLLRSVEMVGVGMAVLIALAIWAASGWLASDWLRTEKLPTEVIAQAFAIMGFVTALRFVEGIYRSSISGLQRQVLLNAVIAAMATLRGLGAVGILVWVTPTLEAFFFWQGGIAFVTIGLLAGCTYRLIPPGKCGGRFSLEAIRRVWRFAGGMLSTTLLVLLVTQIDKVLLSKILTLSEYGNYMIATLVAGTIGMFIGPIAQASYPQFCDLQTSNDQDRLIEAYHKAAQLVTVIAGSVGVVVMLFAREILYTWTQNMELADKASPTVSVIMFGNLLHGMMVIPYQMQLAHGWTSLGIKANLAILLIVIPMILWVTPTWGAIGAAWVWVGVCFYYVFVTTHYMYRRILRTEKWRWYAEDIMLPLGAAITIAVLCRFCVPFTSGRFESILLISLVAGATFIASALASRHMRKYLKKTFQFNRLPRD